MYIYICRCVCVCARVCTRRHKEKTQSAGTAEYTDWISAEE